MKKTLLAAALAVGFAGVAQAETSVTLYGIIDTGISYQEHENVVRGIDPVSGNVVTADRKRTGLHDGTYRGQSGSRWGLKGTEDLGNGLRAVFQLESGIDVTNGSHAQGGRLFGRHATLGLHSDSWGRIDFGRQTNVGSQYMLGMIDPFGGGFGQANAGSAFKSISTVRYDNSVIYHTPNFSGFQFGVGYSFNTNNSDGSGNSQEWKYDGEDNPNNRAITAGIRYANGPIGVALVYDQQKNSSNGGFADVTKKAWALGGAYDFEVVKVSAAFGQIRNGFSFTGGNSPFYDLADGLNPITIANYGVREFDDGFKANTFMVGLSAPVGAGRILASWHMADPRSNPDRPYGADVDGTGGQGSWDLEKQQTYSLGYTYPLSKRTNVYAYGSMAKNVNFIDDQDSKVVGIGLRHQF